MGERKVRSTVFEWTGVPRLSRAVPLAMQHVVAMIVGCVAPAIMVASAAGLSDEDAVILIQAALVMSALTTLLQLFPFIRTRWFAIGSGLPVIMGISFAYVPSMMAIAEEYDVATILGAQMIGGVTALLVGVFIKQIRHFFPPLITGTVVFAIGLSLYPTAVNYMAGGAGSTDYGSWKNWMVAAITLMIVIGLNYFGRDAFKLASILIGIAGGYLVALALGMVDFSGVEAASAFQLPKLLHFGIRFRPSACVAMGILFAINAIQAIGDFSATTSGAMDRMPTDEELRGGIEGYGVANIVCALFGGLPTATYSQNVGIVSTTKVINRCVLGLAAVILLVAGLVPKFSSILTTIPYCVLGGATISVFSSIAMTGVKLIFTEKMTPRDTTVVGLSIALGMGVTQAAGCLSGFPEWVTTIFGKSPVVLATAAAVLLNRLLPGAECETQKNESEECALSDTSI